MMRTRKTRNLKVRSRRRKTERGVALITALLLLLLLTGLSVVMVYSANSDLMTNGYYRGYRGAFYAADSGVNIARQTMENQIKAQFPANFGTGAAPVTGATVAANVTAAINTLYGGANYTNITGAGQASKSYPASFRLSAANVTYDTANPTVSCVLVGGAANGTCANPAWSPTANQYGYQYSFGYNLTAAGAPVLQGSSSVSGTASISENGAFTVQALLVPNGSQTPFSAWGMFIDQYQPCSGGTLVPGTISGPVFTNGGWTFGTSGKYIFTDAVGSASSVAGYHFSGQCDKVAGTSDSNGSGNSKVTIAPTFQNGFNLGQAKVPLPPNDYNQERAVLDGKGVGGAAVTNSDLNSKLQDVTGKAYPSNGASNGVFLPYTTTNGVKTLTGGGIFVQGDANVTLSTSGTSAQVYSIVQGGTTTTITIDPVANSTVMVSGNKSVTLAGVPRMLDPATGADLGPNTMLYVNGNISSLSGTAQGVAAIQDGTALTITAANNVTITGDILYKTEPVTLTQNQLPNTPADTLIPGNNKGQALGIFTAHGDIQMDNAQSNGNLQIDASIATICDPSGGGCSGNGGLVNTGNSINTLTIVGGRIQNQIKNINTTTRNVFFDRRYAGGGFAPPWFPSTNVSVGGLSQPTVNISLQRLQWLSKNSPY